MSESDGMSKGEVLENVRAARALLQEIYVRSDVPSFSNAAYHADVHCHALLWSLGEERGIAPELEELEAEDAR